MTDRRNILEQISIMGAEVVLFDELDEALVGFMEIGDGSYVPVYDEEACLSLFESQGMTMTEAVEHLEYNVRGAAIADPGPVFITPVWPE